MNKNYSSFTADSKIESIVYKYMNNDSSDDEFQGESSEDHESIAPAEEDYDIFRDDEEMLKSSSGNGDTNDDLASYDSVLAEEDDSAAIKQLDGMITWSIDGLYNEDDRTHRSLYLKENPPILSIESSQGDEVNFILTRELTRTLSSGLSDLEKAYFGQRKNRGENGIFGGDSAIEWAKKNPVKAGVTLLVGFAFFAVLVLNLFS